MQTNELQGRVAIVTGGGQSIGFAISETLGKAGATVIVADINAEVGQKAVAQLADLGVEAKFIETDTSARASVDSMVAEVLSSYGKIDILVNNAAITGGSAP